jgi:membrane-bound serine protease (ClpP class)
MLVPFGRSNRTVAPAIAPLTAGCNASRRAAVTVAIARKLLNAYLRLAFFGLQVLPVNFAGLLLLLFGLSLLMLEVKIASYRLLTAGGLASVLLGSMMLTDSAIPELQVSLRLVLPIVFGVAGIAVFLPRMEVASQRQGAVTGVAGMIGEVGVALTAIEPGQRGRVTTHGEIWTAIATEPITEGHAVCITRIDGLTLTVRNA